MIVMAVSAVSVGCYTQQPTGGAVPPAGTPMAFDITDAGRVALGGSMGPEISQVEGRLLDRDSSSYLIAVTGIHLLRGGEQSWAGEQVRLRTEHVSNCTSAASPRVVRLPWEQSVWERWRRSLFDR
jgi:hypothetical protein